MVQPASTGDKSGGYIETSPLTYPRRGPGRANRTTVGLDPVLLNLVDLQARLEGTNRAALTRKAAYFYLDDAAQRETAITTIATRHMTAEEIDDALNSIGEPGKRATVQLDKATALALQAQADDELTSLGALTRKALRFYIMQKNDAPIGIERLVEAVGGR